MKNPFDITGTIMLFIGALFAFLPHALHSSIAFPDESHIFHVIFGITLMLVGLAILAAARESSKRFIRRNKT